MQRVRMSLPFFKDFGWDAEVVVVDEKYSEVVCDNLLLQSIPADISIHKVNAFSKKWTSKLGLGSLALRSLWFYRKKVNQLLKEKHFDLIYFSTTQFPVCILGAYWKKRFGIPYVIDMQDPWHSEYYRDKPKEQQPAKYWFSYRLHKYLEPIAMKAVDGLISVSENYIHTLKSRYTEITNVPSATITFGAFEHDFEIAEASKSQFKSLPNPDFINVVYIGRGGKDMHQAVRILFNILKLGLQNDYDSFKKLKFYFIGTSYAPNGQGSPTILPLAKELEVETHVVEITERISYYHTLATLKQADALFVPGSDDPNYTASKIYPYILTQKPIVAIFNKKSSVVEILSKHTKNNTVLTFPDTSSQKTEELYNVLSNWGKEIFNNISLLESFNEYSAYNLTGLQVQLFDKAISYFNKNNT